MSSMQAAPRTVFQTRGRPVSATACLLRVGCGGAEQANTCSGDEGAKPDRNGYLPTDGELIWGQRRGFDPR